MKALLLISSLLFSQLIWSQNKQSNSKTGRVVTSEDQYNEQTEKCKIGSSSNAAVTPTTKPSNQTNSSKVKER